MKKTLIILLILVLLCSLMSLLSACGQEADESGMRVEVTEDGKTVYDGSEQYSYEIEKDGRGELHFHFSGESGSISARVYMKGYPEYPYYQGTDIPDSNFTVTLIDPGEYIVEIEAAEYMGQYGITWSAR